jgi:hypothetical protein
MTFYLHSSITAYHCTLLPSSGPTPGLAWGGGTISTTTGSILKDFNDLKSEYSGSTIDLDGGPTVYSSKLPPYGYSSDFNAHMALMLWPKTVDAPGCVNSLTSACPEVNSAAAYCWSHPFPPGPVECFCSEMITNSCSDVCRAAGDSNSYRNLILELCNTARFKKSWPPLRAYLVPWSWQVVPDSTRSSEMICPSTTAKLGSFALINILVGCSSLVLGRRTIVQKFTFGFLGKLGSPHWVFMSILIVTLNLIANVVNALLLRRVPGFSNVPITSLIIFWVSRPRLAWLATCLANFEREKGMYFSAAASAFLTEIILQTIGAAYIGQAVYFGSVNGMYKIRSQTLDETSYKGAARLFYGGAVLWMASVGIFYVYVLLVLGVGNVLVSALKRSLKWLFAKLERVYKTFISATKRVTIALKRRRKATSLVQEDEQAESKNGLAEIGAMTLVEPDGVSRAGDMDWIEALENMGLKPNILTLISGSFAFLFLPWIGQWLFWAGFVKVYADW